MGPCTFKWCSAARVATAARIRISLTLIELFVNNSNLCSIKNMKCELEHLIWTHILVGDDGFNIRGKELTVWPSSGSKCPSLLRLR